MQPPRPVRLILASASTTRLALLRGAGLAVEAMPTHVDEAAIRQAAWREGVDADETAMLLAGLKAARITRREPDALVIAADQILVCDDRWLGKPESAEEAREQLGSLRGRTHTLVTAVLCQRGEARIWHTVARPRLVMRPFSDAFLDDYLAEEGAAVTGTAGGYRLEGLGAQLFDEIAGDYFAVLGLPLLPLLGFLRQHGALAS